jgi:hypothetical protein
MFGSGHRIGIQSNSFVADHRFDAPLAWFRRLFALVPSLGALALVTLLVGWQAGWAPLLAQNDHRQARSPRCHPRAPPPHPGVGGQDPRHASL